MSRNLQTIVPTEKWSSKGLELDPKYRGVKSEEVCVGSIVWLRQRRSNEEDIMCVRQGHCSADFKLLDNGYRHPVVILKIWQRRGSTEPGDLMLGVSDLTTFKDIPFRKYMNHRNLIKFEESIPILQPGEIANPNIEQLSLASGGLDRKSYVRLQHLLLVSVKCLWMYRWTEESHAYDHRLDRQSYEKVMTELGVDPDQYDSTDAVINTGGLRNITLARKEAMGLCEKYRLQSEGSGNSGKGKAHDSKGSYTAEPSLVAVNQHQDARESASNSKTSNPAAQGWFQTFASGASCNLRPLEAPHPSEAQPHSPFVSFPENSLSLPAKNQTFNIHGGITDAPNPYWSSGSVPVHQNAGAQPIASSYSTPAAYSFPPAVENNFYFHGSTAYFDAPINPIRFGFQNRQGMQPAYHSVGQPFGGGVQETFHDENSQHKPQKMGQDWHQQMPQPTGQEIAQPIPLYHQMTESYGPNQIAPQYQPTPAPTSFSPSIPVTSTQVNSWSAELSLQQHQEHGQNFQPQIPPPLYRTLRTVFRI